ncbi:MAG: methylmalonyl Co-A mutase-associated GTPase MeaB, partial [Flavobacteriales bacterium]|nr:methylmalonyl Co-A mutase-associated GTPase MeaB [Flavobacteriales bacterium]
MSKQEEARNRARQRLKNKEDIPLDVDLWYNAIVSGDIKTLSQAITICESTREEDRDFSVALVERCSQAENSSFRIGITGVPGVGKSTFIEAFGNAWIKEGKKVAVLAVDPSSNTSKGSIMGDKTRMETLSANPMAFIRPSATNQSLGGVTARTREAIILCECAGFDIILVETVGVGQSEVAV